MRKGMDGPVALAQTALAENPFSGHYVTALKMAESFISGRRSWGWRLRRRLQTAG
jgi:hypothetical protein